MRCLQLLQHCKWRGKVKHVCLTKLARHVFMHIGNNCTEGHELKINPSPSHNTSVVEVSCHHLLILCDPNLTAFVLTLGEMEKGKTSFSIDCSNEGTRYRQRKFASRSIVFSSAFKSPISSITLQQ